MKILNIITLSLLALSLTPGITSANGNLSDDLDKNTTPAPLEEREEEIINQGDVRDSNVIPSTLEDREEQEEVESDVLQTDDPEKAYDPMDEEIDE